jgi:hypothetical protein
MGGHFQREDGEHDAMHGRAGLEKELGVGYASVGHRDATVLVNGRYVKIYLPRNVENKIRFWDRFHMALPFSFELACSGFLTGESHFQRPAAPEGGIALLERYA